MNIHVYSPEKGYFIAIFDNVTERKKNLDQLQFQACLLGAAGQAIVALDTNGIIRYWNHAAENLYGYSQSETIGRGGKEVLATLTSKKQAEEIYSREMNREAWSSEMMAKRKDGSEITLIVNRAPILNCNNGDFLGVTSVSTDISEQKWLETELSASVDELLSNMKKIQELNEKLHVVGSLTRHDVRNKLSIVTGNTFLLKKKLSDRPDILSNIKLIEQACSDTVEIFELAKTYEQMGVQELNYISVDQTIQEATVLFSNQLNIKITNNCQGLVVLADTFLRQMFYNLIDNSAKHGQKTTMIKIIYEKPEQDRLKIIYQDDV